MATRVKDRDRGSRGAIARHVVADRRQAVVERPELEPLRPARREHDDAARLAVAVCQLQPRLPDLERDEQPRPDVGSDGHQLVLHNFQSLAREA